MIHAESILNAIVLNLTGLPTTGNNVQRGQVYPHETSKLPALGVYMGADEIQTEYQTDKLDWELQVFVEPAVEQTLDYLPLDSDIESALNQIRGEVHAAMLADYTQGLPFVIDTIAGSAAAPVLSGEGAKPLATQALEYTILYRSSRNALDV